MHVDHGYYMSVVFLVTYCFQLGEYWRYPGPMLSSQCHLRRCQSIASHCLAAASCHRDKPRTAKASISTSIRHRSDTDVSDRCLIDVDTCVFLPIRMLHSESGGHCGTPVCWIPWHRSHNLDKAYAAKPFPLTSIWCRLNTNVSILCLIDVVTNVLSVANRVFHSETGHPGLLHSSRFHDTNTITLTACWQQGRLHRRRINIGRTHSYWIDIKLTSMSVCFLWIICFNPMHHFTAGYSAMDSITPIL